HSREGVGAAEVLLNAAARWRIDTHGARLHRHLGLELPILARAVLSEAGYGQAPSAVLREPIRQCRAQRRVLSHAFTRRRARLARGHARRFRVCVEGVKIYHALEAAERQVA